MARRHWWSVGVLALVLGLSAHGQEAGQLSLFTWLLDNGRVTVNGFPLPGGGGSVKGSSVVRLDHLLRRGDNRIVLAPAGDAAPIRPESELKVRRAWMADGKLEEKVWLHARAPLAGEWSFNCPDAKHDELPWLVTPRGELTNEDREAILALYTKLAAAIAARDADAIVTLRQAEIAHWAASVGETAAVWQERYRQGAVLPEGAVVKPLPAAEVALRLMPGTSLVVLTGPANAPVLMPYRDGRALHGVRLYLCLVEGTWRIIHWA